MPSIGCLDFDHEMVGENSPGFYSPGTAERISPALEARPKYAVLRRDYRSPDLDRRKRVVVRICTLFLIHGNRYSGLSGVKNDEFNRAVRRKASMNRSYGFR